MLTKNDLQQIGELLDSRLEPIKQDVGTLKSDVGTLKSDVGTLKSDVGTLKSDVDVLKKQAKITNKRLRKVEKDVSVAINMFDQNIVRAHRRIDKIEDHLGTAHH